MDYMSIIACIPIGRANRITLYVLEELLKLKTEVFNNAQQDT